MLTSNSIGVIDSLTHFDWLIKPASTADITGTGSTIMFTISISDEHPPGLPVVDISTGYTFLTATPKLTLPLIVISIGPVPDTDVDRPVGNPETLKPEAPVALNVAIFGLKSELSQSVTDELPVLNVILLLGLTVICPANEVVTHPDPTLGIIK